MREKGSLAGATAIVTGASSGIGYGIASRPAVLMRSALTGAKKIPASGRCAALNSIFYIRV
jgi:NAD(P)-dependent dehydrogenase (short-subunit alcohol dehydrogenase family)